MFFVRRWLGVSPSLGSVTKIVASGGVALGAGLLCAQVSDILGTVVAIAVFVGLVLALGLSRATRSTR